MSSELSGDRKAAMEQKIEALRRMIAFSRSVPNSWNEHDNLARTRRAASASMRRSSIAISVRCCRPRSCSFRAACAPQRLQGAADRSRARDDEPDRRRQWLRNGHHAQNFASGADREFLQQMGYERNPIAKRTAVSQRCLHRSTPRWIRRRQLPGAKDLAAAF